jgi:hypothetical protein
MIIHPHKTSYQILCDCSCLSAIGLIRLLIIKIFLDWGTEEMSKEKGSSCHMQGHTEANDKRIMRFECRQIEQDSNDKKDK